VFLRHWIARGYWYGGYHGARAFAYRHAAKRDGTPGLRTRAEFDALLAPTVAILQQSAVACYWQAVAGPVVVRAAIQRGVAKDFLASLGDLTARLARPDYIRLREAEATGSREPITFNEERA
jgi:hypothetical protein